MSTATTYIAFLRAINVAGRMVSMERLRGLFRELGYDNVRTYIQTGNVFFDSPQTDVTLLTSRIEAHLLASVGHEVETFVRSIADVERAMTLDAFRGIDFSEDVLLCVAFINKPLPPSLTLPHKTSKGDTEIVAATDTEAFLLIRIIDGRFGNPGAWLEKTYKLRATLRFYHTLGKILAAAKTT